MRTKTDADIKKDCDELIRQFSRVRAASGVTQYAVADLCGMLQPSISRIECGDTVPGLMTMLKMADAVGYRLVLVPAHDADVISSDEQEEGHMISLECRVRDVFGRDAFPFDERTLRHIRTLFEEYGYAGVLQRGPVCELLSMEASGVSILFTKLKEAGILEPVPGLRRGNYRFVRGAFRHI